MVKSWLLPCSLVLLMLIVCTNATVPATVRVTTNPFLYLSNSLIDQGQSILFTATAPVGSAGPFSYNYLIFNSANGTIVANELYTNVASATNTFFWTSSANIPATNTLVANVVTIDSNSITENSIAAQIGYNALPVITLTPSLTIINAGQTETYTVSVTGGTAPFDIELYNVSGTSQQGHNVIIQSSGGTNSISFITSVIGTFTYNAIATDDGTSAIYVFNSSNSTITVQSGVSKTGGGGGGGGVTGGGGGLGGPSIPTVIRTNSTCFVATNIAEYNTFDLNLTTGLKVTENFINPDGAGVTVNGQLYTLSVNSTYRILNSTVSIRLINVSYLPIQHTVSLQICSIQQAPVPQAALTYKPIYVTAQPGETLLSQLDLQNPGSTPESVSLNVGSNQSLIVLSTNNIDLSAHENVSIQLMFQSAQNAKPGTYDIPIDIISTINGTKTERTIEIIFVIQNKTVNLPSYSSQIGIANYTTNYTNIATGIIKISSPSNFSISNVSLKTTMPLPVANSISQIIAYGLNNNVSVVNGNYLINWYISYIPAGQSVYAYYTVVRPSNEVSLTQIKNKFGTLPPNQKQNILKLINIIVPVFYANSTDYVSVYVLYKGIVTQRVIFTLNTTQGVTVLNSPQIANASPNQIINKTFAIAVPQELKGPLILNLSVRTAGGNLSYILPIGILPSTISTTIIQKQPPYVPITIDILIIVIAALIIFFIIYRKRRKKPKEKKGL